MATTGRGDFPFRSAWFHNRLAPLPVYKRIGIGGGVVHQAVWSDWFFDAAAATGISHPLTGKFASLLAGKFG